VTPHEARCRRGAGRRWGGAAQDRTVAERGAVAMMVTLMLVPLLGAAALVVDLGQMRASKRAEQSAADLAALAAGYFIGGAEDGIPSPRAACNAALQSAKTNLAGIPTGAALSCNTFPVVVDEATCPTLLTTTVSSTGSAPYSVRVTFPVPGSSIADSRYAGAGSNDGTSPCERMKVEIRRVDKPVFGRILDGGDQETGANAVVRARPTVEGDGVAALVLLERVGCAVLQASGGGSQGSGIVVQSSAAGKPGVIHADSIGQVGACTTNENASGYVIYGTALPAAGGGGPSIHSLPPPSGGSGVISMRALMVGGRAAAQIPTGVAPQPIPAPVLSRRAADRKYNTASAVGGRAQITAMHAAGYAAATMTASQATAAGYTVLSGRSYCVTHESRTHRITATKVFFDCPSGFSTGGTYLPNATDVVFSGSVSIANNQVLSMPVARNVSIRGCGGCSGGDSKAISVQGELRVNTGGDGTAATACSARKGPGAGGTVTNWTRLATFSGPFEISGQVRLCQTFVYLGSNSSTYSATTQINMGVAPEYYPLEAACSVVRPCPSDIPLNSYIDVTGGGGTVDWTAPNQLTVQPNYASLGNYPFEDLALWSETSQASSIKGQGSNATTGVYFVPNATVTFTGQATQTIPLEAQFIVRRLNVASQGTLWLRPSMADSVLIPQVAIINLIR